MIEPESADTAGAIRVPMVEVEGFDVRTERDAARGGRLNVWACLGLDDDQASTMEKRRVRDVRSPPSFSSSSLGRGAPLPSVGCSSPPSLWRSIRSGRRRCFLFRSTRAPFFGGAQSPVLFRGRTA